MIRRRYVDVSFGQVHVASVEPDPHHPTSPALPVVCLHQTPRSWDEYREVLPALGRHRAAFAPDTPGMGASDPAPGTGEHGAGSIEALAAGLREAIDVLGLDRFHLVGHHTGGVIAVELAAMDPDRIGRLVLSSTPLIDAKARAARRDRPPVDGVEVSEDGEHLRELWNGRRTFYPPDRPDVLQRFLRDALAVEDAQAGHHAVSTYRMEDRLGALAETPTLLIGHRRDPHAAPHLEPLAERLEHAQVAWIEDGMVPLEFTASQFAQIVGNFLRSSGM